MSVQQAKTLKIGDIVYFDYEKSIVVSLLEVDGDGNESLLVQKGKYRFDATVSDLFFPTEHVVNVSNMVLEKEKLFSGTKPKNVFINKDIYGLFNAHFAKMCNAESEENYLEQKESFEAFFNDLMEATEFIKNLEVHGVTYLHTM